MPDARHELGRRGEVLAERFLGKRGWKTIARNFSTPAGEIDRIMREGTTIVFVEVKTLSDRRIKDPEVSVTRAKVSRMTRAALWFLTAKGWTDRQWRFDIVSIVVPPEGEAEIEHFENIHGG